MRQTCGMMISATSPCYQGFPQAIILHAVWLSSRFNLSYRDVEELLAAHGVNVTYETVRQWCKKFGQASANQLRRRRAEPRDKWHMDEVFLKNQWEKALPLAGRRSSRDRLGYPRPEPTEPGSRQEVLPQPPQGLYVRPARDHALYVLFARSNSPSA
jgi:hypothetical protein